jgi:hypothetical protein
VIFTDDPALVERLRQEIEQDIQNSWILDEAYAKRIWSGTGRIERFLIKRALKHM